MPNHPVFLLGDLLSWVKTWVKAFQSKYTLTDFDLLQKQFIMTYGYVRVSTKGQSELWQVLALEDLGISIKQTYTDKQGGKDFDRPQYKKLLRKLKSGDILAFAAAIEIDPKQVPPMLISHLARPTRLLNYWSKAF